jgi:biopolymer transport protein ExbD
MMKIGRRERPAPYIPFISLADIAWQIIIFFLIASTFLKSDALSVAMPSASPDPEQSISKTVMLEAGDSTLTVNGVPVALDDLEGYLSDLLVGATTEDQRAVIARFHNDLSFQRNADIMYAIQRAGGVVVVSEERDREDGAREEAGAAEGQP